MESCSLHQNPPSSGAQRGLLPDLAVASGTVQHEINVQA
jgi:hypothetical protein